MYHYRKLISWVWKPERSATASFYSLEMKDIAFSGNFGYWIKHHLCDSGTRDKTTYLQTFLIGNKDQVSKLFREQFTRHPEIPRDPLMIFVLKLQMLLIACIQQNYQEQCMLQIWLRKDYQEKMDCKTSYIRREKG